LIRLVGIDVDGTLIGSSGVVARRSGRAPSTRAGWNPPSALFGRPRIWTARELAARLDPGGLACPSKMARNILNLADQKHALGHTCLRTAVGVAHPASAFEPACTRTV